MRFWVSKKNIYTKAEIREQRKDLILAVISGILLGISYPPIPLPFLSFVAFIPLFFVLEKRKSAASVNRMAYVMLFVFTLITLYWVGSWTKEADPFLMFSGAALIFLNPFFYLIATTLFAYSKKRFDSLPSLLLFPFYWVSFEYLYSITDLRFPWLILGNSGSYFNLFIQIADIVGAHGLSLIILYINIFIYLAVKNYAVTKKINKVWLAAAFALFVIPIIYGTFSITKDENPIKIKVGLIQPNINPWDKWGGGSLDEQLNNYLELSDQAVKQGAELIIWPESALPVYLFSGNYDFEVSRIREFVTDNKVSLLTGMPDINFYFDSTKAPSEAKKTKGGYFYTSYNSILLFEPGKFTTQKYKKMLLVPFGEHVPFVEHLPFLGDFIKWEVGISSWNIGKEQIVFNMYNRDSINIKAGGVICIESIYPDFVAGFVKNGAQFLSVVTNDSWYGYSSGPFQHKEIGVLRAVENRRTVVRAANGGVSCIIDPNGKTLSETKLFERTILVGDVSLRNEITFFTKYPLMIPLISCFISILTLIIILIKKFFPNKNENKK